MVESSNSLQMRRVCKFWKSLVVDFQVMTKHFHRFSNEVTDRTSKATKHINAFKSQHPEQDAGVEDAVEEKEDKKEEDDAAPDKEKLKQCLMIEVADLNKILVKILSIKEDMKTVLKVDLQTQAVDKSVFRDCSCSNSNGLVS